MMMVMMMMMMIIIIIIIIINSFLNQFILKFPTPQICATKTSLFLISVISASENMIQCSSLTVTFSVFFR